MHSFVILDQDGSRILAKYFDGRSTADQLSHENSLAKKSRSMNTKSEGKHAIMSVLTCHLTILVIITYS